MTAARKKNSHGYPNATLPPPPPPSCPRPSARGNRPAKFGADEKQGASGAGRAKFSLVGGVRKASFQGTQGPTMSDLEGAGRRASRRVHRRRSVCPRQQRAGQRRDSHTPTRGIRWGWLRLHRWWPWLRRLDLKQGQPILNQRKHRARPARIVLVSGRTSRTTPTSGPIRHPDHHQSLHHRWIRGHAAQ
jgi:hypothetical protein